MVLFVNSSTNSVGFIGLVLPMNDSTISMNSLGMVLTPNVSTINQNSGHGKWLCLLHDIFDVAHNPFKQSNKLDLFTIGQSMRHIGHLKRDKLICVPT